MDASSDIQSDVLSSPGWRGDVLSMDMDASSDIQSDVLSLPGWRGDVLSMDACSVPFIPGDWMPDEANADVSYVDNFPTSQYGGGLSRPRRRSATPSETPTKLRPYLKATTRDDGIITTAKARRAALLPGGSTSLGDLDLENGQTAHAEYHTVNGELPAALERLLDEQGFRAEPPSYRINPEAHFSLVDPPNQGGHSTTEAPFDPDVLPATDVSPPTSARSQASVSPKTTGRMSSRTHTLLSNGISKVEALLGDISAETGLPITKILSALNKGNDRIMTNGHSWNNYLRYFAAHAEEEICRAYGAERPSDPIDHEVWQTCWTAFKQAYPDTYKSILDTWIDAESCDEGMTVGQRQGLFNKTYQRVCALVDSAALRWGFQTALVMTGSLVNDDASLGKVHETSRIEGLFSVRFRANSDIVVGHAKTHVFDSVSRELTRETWEDMSSIEGFVETTKAKVEPVPSTSALKPTESSSNASVIKDRITQNFEIAGGSWPSKHLLPWSTMCSVLAAQGYVLHNYPRIPLPGEPTSTKAKGIASLTKKQREILAESLDHPTNPLRFEKVSQADHMLLKKSSKPIIIGVCPSPESKNRYGRRQFANGVCDDMGLERLPRSTSTATTVVRPSRKALTLHNNPPSSSPTILPAKSTRNARPAPRRKLPKSKEIIGSPTEEEVDGSTYDDSSEPSDSDIEEITPVSKKRKNNDTSLGPVRKIHRGRNDTVMDAKQAAPKGKRRAQATPESSPLPTPVQKRTGKQKEVIPTKGDRPKPKPYKKADVVIVSGDNSSPSSGTAGTFQEASERAGGSPKAAGLSREGHTRVNEENGEAPARAASTSQDAPGRVTGGSTKSQEGDMRAAEGTREASGRAVGGLTEGTEGGVRVAGGMMEVPGRAAGGSAEGREGGVKVAGGTREALGRATGGKREASQEGKKGRAGADEDSPEAPARAPSTSPDGQTVQMRLAATSLESRGEMTRGLSEGRDTSTRATSASREVWYGQEGRGGMGGVSRDGHEGQEPLGRAAGTYLEGWHGLADEQVRSMVGPDWEHAQYIQQPLRTQNHIAYDSQAAYTHGFNPADGNQHRLTSGRQISYKHGGHQYQYPPPESGRTYGPGYALPRGPSHPDSYGYTQPGTPLHDPSRPEGYVYMPPRAPLYDGPMYLDSQRYLATRPPGDQHARFEGHSEGQRYLPSRHPSQGPHPHLEGYPEGQRYMVPRPSSQGPPTHLGSQRALAPRAPSQDPHACLEGHVKGQRYPMSRPPSQDPQTGPNTHSLKDQHQHHEGRLQTPDGQLRLPPSRVYGSSQANNMPSQGELE